MGLKHNPIMVGPFHVKPAGSGYSAHHSFHGLFGQKEIVSFCSPSTQRIESTIFDLPDPLGPITHDIPSLNFKEVFWANDLNPNMSTFDKYMMLRQLRSNLP